MKHRTIDTPYRRLLNMCSSIVNQSAGHPEGVKRPLEKRIRTDKCIHRMTTQEFENWALSLRPRCYSSSFPGPHGCKRGIGTMPMCMPSWEVSYHCWLRFLRDDLYSQICTMGGDVSTNPQKPNDWLILRCSMFSSRLDACSVAVDITRHQTLRKKKFILCDVKLQLGPSSHRVSQKRPSTTHFQSLRLGALDLVELL